MRRYDLKRNSNNDDDGDDDSKYSAVTISSQLFYSVMNPAYLI